MQDFEIIIGEPDDDGRVAIHNGLDGPIIATCENIDHAHIFTRGLEMVVFLCLAR